MSHVQTQTLMTYGMTADRQRQSKIGTGLAVAVIAAWLTLHIMAIFFFPWPLAGWHLWAAPAIVLALCWLYVALFIVAHDCMHGTVAPSWPWLNPWIGRICLLLYAGFSFSKMRAAHQQHHQQPGTSGDPDFDHHEPHAFWPWYLKFFAEYYGTQEFFIMFVATGLYMAMGAPYQNMLLFWGIPSLMSSLQLFVFGTYLPHSPGAAPFADRHRARSNDYPWLISLLTCLHFGYHHEHHATPGVPWWRLPQLRAARARSQAVAAPAE
jgi:beta-carotene/zeaxanthin 4-ketolase